MLCLLSLNRRIVLWGLRSRPSPQMLPQSLTFQPRDGGWCFGIPFLSVLSSTVRGAVVQEWSTFIFAFLAWWKSIRGSYIQTFCCLWSTHYRIHVTYPLSANYGSIYKYIINEVSMILPVEGRVYSSDICWHIFMARAILLFFFLYYLALNMISRRHLSHLHE